MSRAIAQRLASVASEVFLHLLNPLGSRQAGTASSQRPTCLKGHRDLERLRAEPEGEEHHANGAQSVTQIYLFDCEFVADFDFALSKLSYLYDKAL